MTIQNLKKFTGAFGLALTVSAAAHAQPVNTCTGFLDAMELAANADPAVATQEARRREATANVDEAKSLFRPQVSAFARTGLGDVGLIDSAIQNQVGLSASQRIFDFGDARLARRAASFGVNASDHDIRLSRQQAAASISSALIDYLQADEALALTSEREQYFKNQLTAIEAVLEDGGATVSERAEVAAQLANAKTFLLDLKSQIEQSRTSIEVETETVPTLCEASVLHAEFSTLAVELDTIRTAIDKALFDAPELRGLSARADSLAAESERERRARLPIISLVGSAAYASVGTADNFELQERLGVDVSVPLYSGDALGARSRRASARQAAAKSEVAERRRELEQDVRITYRRILSLQAQIITARDFEKSSKDLFEFAEYEYEAGTRTLPDLVEVRLEYEQAGLRSIALKYELMRERLALLTLTGDIFK